jgi:uncharacterized protein YjbI with pentapeptide repeats/beta-lactamase regulating signal transducer with metallopeptidase domain
MMPLLDGVARAVLVIFLNGLWQGAVIAGITWGALRLSPRVNASTRYAAWTLALVATLIVPVATSLTHISYQTAVRPSVRTRQADVAASALRPAAEPEGASSVKTATSAAPHLSLPQAPAVTVAPPAVLTTALFALWALAAAALAVRLAVALLQLERLKRDAMPLSMDYRDRLLKWQAHAGVDRDVRICVTGGIEVPVAVGLFDAMVLLPQHLLETLDANEIDQISLHELAHLLRHDDWTNSFQRVATSLLFFNPAVWFIARQMDIEREVACDDYVLELTGAVRNYAYCLTKMAEMTSWPHEPLAAPGVFVTRKNISIRIERLLRTGRAISSSISPATAVAVVAGLAAAFVIARALTPVVAFALPAAPQVALEAATAPPREHAPEQRRSHTERPLPSAKPRVEETEAPPRPRFFPSPAPPPVSLGNAIDRAVGKALDAAAATKQIAQVSVPRARNVALTPGCTGCNFSNADMAGKDFRNENLTGSDFDSANLDGARFDNADLSGVNFSNANLHNASFVNANLTGCDLEDANLDGARFDGARLSGCNVDVKKLTPPQTRMFLTRCSGCNFASADLRGMDLRGIKLVGIDLSDAKLQGARLDGSVFSGVDFSNADFSGADLNGTTFYGCDFSGADLRHVDLSRTSFVGSSLGDARMKP